MSNKANICLLLTGNIAPQQVPDLKRNGVGERENDYVQAIEKWLTMGYSVVFCENSNYQSQRISQLFENSPNSEFLQFETQQSHLGKGHGEAEIFEYAFKHSQVLKNHDSWIVKVTGRYFVKNIQRMLTAIETEGNSKLIYTDLSRNLTWADARFFVFRQAFYERYLSFFLSQINEGAGVYFEHILAKAILKSMIDKPNWAFLPEYPLYEGVLGTYNVPLRTNFWRQWKNHVLLSLKKYAFAHCT